MTWTCVVCQNVNTLSTWCSNPKCKARWNSTKDKPIYPPETNPTASHSAAIGSGADAWPRRTSSRQPSRDRSQSRPSNRLKGKGNGKGKDTTYDSDQPDNDKSDKKELEPWLKNLGFIKNPPYVSMSTWEDSLTNQQLPAPPPADATKETTAAYFDNIRETLRLAQTTYRMEWLMGKSTETADITGACKRRLLNSKSLEDQLKEVEKFTELGTDKLQEMIDVKNHHEEMTTKLNLLIAFKHKDLATLERCREEIRAYLAEMEQRKEYERRLKNGKLPSDPYGGKKPAGEDADDDDEILHGAAPAAPSPFSASTPPGPCSASAASPFADQVRSQSDILSQINHKMDEKMGAIQQDFQRQLMEMQRNLMQVMAGRSPSPAPRAAASPTIPATSTPSSTPPQASAAQAPQPTSDIGDEAPKMRMGQERFREDRSPVRSNIKEATMHRDNGNAHAAEAARAEAKNKKLQQLRQSDQIDLTNDENSDDHGQGETDDPTAPQTAGGA